MSNRGARAAVLKDSLIQIVDALREIRVPYMVIGAFALPAWGRPRATLDLDFIPGGHRVALLFALAPGPSIRPSASFAD